ncbi:glycosyltransferase family 31 protein [Whalleya microplaca]|nr:glycosyltransferase family 31 protein [Whalleya microplaca]
MLQKATWSRKLRPVLIISIFSLYVLLSLYRAPVLQRVPAPRSKNAGPVCPEAALAKDVLLVLRTGATEVLEKLPIHFETTLKCVSDYVIFSDMEEDIGSHHIHDVLDQVNDTLRNTVPEFKLYNQLRTRGRKGLKPKTTFGSGPGGAAEKSGWKLDKWKFLPMVDRALQHRPNAKWFVFVEPDTYVAWHNVLEYLNEFDARKSHYIGKHMYVGDVLFAYGGSGFTLSNPAMRRVVEYWRSHQDELDQYTEKEWAGDMILGKTVKDAGIDMSSAFPHLQEDSLTTINWNVSKLERQPWCYAPLTFHHMSQAEFSRVWRFEQQWHRRNRGKATLRFRDVFKSLIGPRLRSERSKWDNMSRGTDYNGEALAKLSGEERSTLTLTEREAHVSFDHCRAVCESKPTCIQFSHAPGKCSISDELRLGHATDEQCLEYSNAAGGCIKSGVAKEEDPANSEDNLVRSGWMMDRVSDYVADLDQSCDRPEGNDWLT